MFNTAVHSAPCALPSPAKSGATVFAQVLTALRLRHSRLDLAQLDAHLLQDIGVAAPQALRESQRHMWDVPNNWRR